MQFQPGILAGVIWRPLTRHTDQRGWLCELFRQDELPAEFNLAMGYISVTEPNVTRGPHEHVEQSDYFCFLGPGDFQIYLWYARADSVTVGAKQVEVVGASRPMIIVVPPGVVHAFRNVSAVPGVVLNFPNLLYCGWARKEVADEIRHEHKSDSPYRIE